MEVVLVEKCTGDIVTMCIFKLYKWEDKRYVIRRESGVLNRSLTDDVINYLITNNVYELVGVV